MNFQASSPAAPSKSDNFARKMVDALIAAAMVKCNDNVSAAIRYVWDAARERMGEEDADKMMRTAGYDTYPTATEVETPTVAAG